MKTDLTRICAVLLGLVVFAAAQDLSPSLLGAKVPLLLVFGCFAGVPAAIGAGLFADALSGLPFGCSAAFFAAAALLARAVKRSPGLSATVAAGLYPLWLALWTGRTFAWAPVAVAALFALALAPFMAALLRLVRRRIGLNVSGGPAQ